MVGVVNQFCVTTLVVCCCCDCKKKKKKEDEIDDKKENPNAKPFGTMAKDIWGYIYGNFLTWKERLDHVYVCCDIRNVCNDESVWRNLPLRMDSMENIYQHNQNFDSFLIRTSTQLTNVSITGAAAKQDYDGWCTMALLLSMHSERQYRRAIAWRRKREVEELEAQWYETYKQDKKAKKCKKYIGNLTSMIKIPDKAKLAKQIKKRERRRNAIIQELFYIYRRYRNGNKDFEYTHIRDRIEKHFAYSQRILQVLKSIYPAYNEKSILNELKEMPNDVVTNVIEFESVPKGGHRRYKSIGASKCNEYKSSLLKEYSKLQREFNRKLSYKEMDAILVDRMLYKLCNYKYFDSLKMDCYKNMTILNSFNINCRRLSCINSNNNMSNNTTYDRKWLKQLSRISSLQHIFCPSMCHPSDICSMLALCSHLKTLIVNVKGPKYYSGEFLDLPTQFEYRQRMPITITRYAIPATGTLEYFRECVKRLINVEYLDSLRMSSIIAGPMADPECIGVCLTPNAIMDIGIYCKNLEEANLYVTPLLANSLTLKVIKFLFDNCKRLEKLTIFHVLQEEQQPKEIIIEQLRDLKLIQMNWTSPTPYQTFKIECLTMQRQCESL